MREDNPSKPAPQPTQRILIAEDDPLMAHAIKRVLRRAGYETAIAADGYLAGSLLHTFRPSLMTLDLRMPCLDGMDVLDFLQGLHEPLQRLACRVLVVSAESDYRIAQALSMGAHAAVSKPFTNDVLLHQVARLLNEGGLKSEVPAASAGEQNDDARA
jgi:DNA-binding response OmpR family regulator